MDYWSTDVNGYEEAIKEINKAIDAGTNMEDIEDYLKDLLELGKINIKDYMYILNVEL